MSPFPLLYPVFVLTIFECICFNIDTKNPIIYLDQSKYLNVAQTNKSSFFGLSVILYPGDNINPPWIQIGAPRSNSPSVAFKNPGIIFRCNISSPCRYIEVDTEGEESTDNSLYYHNKLDDAWIGAVMDINMRFNRTVVCAPRWINIVRRGKPKEDYRMLGSCYWSNINSYQFHKRIPLLNSDRYTYDDATSGINVYDYGQGESGFSIHMPESKNEFMLGAPGVFNWKGTNILYTDQIVVEDEPPSSRLTMHQRDINDRKQIRVKKFSNANVAEARTTTEITDYSLSGYAVTSGCFYSNQPNCLHYVTGAPKSTRYLGKVLIFKFQKHSAQSLNVRDSRQGTQFGEYFGGSLAAGDINNDGLDDLFVGAPFHKSSKYNEGRMYLFLGSKKGLLEYPSDGKFIDGTKPHSQFGTTITYLGKLNNDMYSRGPNYVAVSAPYEESSGVVYIFRGYSSGLDIVPVQRIVGSSFLPNLKGFGISISKPVDIDGNGYEDIAIGAYESGHVVLLRSRPLVRLETYFQSIPTNIRKEENKFNITVCHKYTSFKGSYSIRIRRSIVVDEVYNRAYQINTNDKSDEIVVWMESPICKNVKINVGNVYNFFKPLVIKITHNLIDESEANNKLIISDRVGGTDEFCQRCGVYDDFNSVRTVTTEIPFALDCGNDDICESELEFKSQFQGKGVKDNTYILGATNVIDIIVAVKNKGEKAYSLRVQIDLPQGLSYKKIPTLCEQQKLRIICPIADPLDTNEEKDISLKLDMDNINSKNEENSVGINVTLLTNSYNKNKASEVVKLKLKTEADISMSGKSVEQSYSYGKDKIVEFQQTYQISKYGFSPVSLVRFVIMIPYQIQTRTGLVNLVSLYQPEGSLGGQSIVFHSDILYIESKKMETMEKIDEDKIHEIRRRRETSDISDVEILQDSAYLSSMSSNIKQDSTNTELLGNKIYEINCSMAEVICANISGKAGSFDSDKKSAVLEFKMTFDTKAIAGFLEKNTVIRFKTYGMVKIVEPVHLVQSGDRPDNVSVSSLFVNDTGKKIVDLWIIVVSAVSGLLLLFLITFGLTKAGFFKRSTKEELENLKAQTGMEDIPEKPKTLDTENGGDP